jgi:hypothetical protein
MELPAEEPGPPTLPHRASRHRRSTADRVAAVGAIGSLVVAWIVGAAFTRTDVKPHLTRALPGAERFVPAAQDSWVALRDGEGVGFVALGEASGYGGPVTLAVAVDEDATVLGIAIVEHRETPSFFGRVTGSGLREDLTGKAWSEPFELGEDVDGVTGAFLCPLDPVYEIIRLGRTWVLEQWPGKRRGLEGSSS